jgi:hypothetical protein
MKLRQQKRATQRRMFSPKARAWRELAHYGREVAEAALQAVALGMRLPESLQRLIWSIAPCPLTEHAEQKLLTFIRKIIPGSSATPDGAAGD